MRADLALIAGWVAFFATTVYGHVAMKLAVDGDATIAEAATGPWGISAFASWGLSALLWLYVLSRHTLLGASSIAALRYGLIAIVAALVFRADVSPRALFGASLVAVGVLLGGGR